MIRKEPKGYDKVTSSTTRRGCSRRLGIILSVISTSLADSLERSGYTSFDEFVQSKVGDGWEPHSRRGAT